MGAFLWLAVAYAKVAPCAGPTVSAAVPGANQVGVPVDIRPAVVLTGCAGQGEVRVVLERVPDGTVHGEVLLTFGDDPQVVRLDPYMPLSPETDYLLRVESQDQPDVEIPFITGSGSVVGLAPPEAEVVGEEARWSAAATSTVARLRVVPTIDPVQASLITVSNAYQVNLPLYAGAAIDTEEVEVAWVGSRPEAQCYTVTQWDGRGVGYATELPCVPVTGSGCASAPPSSAGAVGLALLLLRRRRRGVARALLQG